MTEEVSDARAPAPKVKINVIRKQKLAELMSKRDENDLRFMHFDACGYMVTATTLLDRETNWLTVAFSFCSPKDSFSKVAGKVKCLGRIEAYEKLAQGGSPQPDEEVAKYIITMPFANVPKVISIGVAYNLLPNKPERIERSKFDFEIYHTVIRK